MKTIRLSVTDDEYTDYRAARRNGRIARRALRRLKHQVAGGERVYTLKADGDHVSVFATLTEFFASGAAEGAWVRVTARLRPIDDASAAALDAIEQAASDAGERFSDALLRSIPASLKRDITTLLDWASPEGVPLWRDSIYVYVEESAKEERRRLMAARGLGAAPAAE